MRPGPLPGWEAAAALGVVESVTPARVQVQLSLSLSPSSPVRTEPRRDGPFRRQWPIFSRPSVRPVVVRWVQAAIQGREGKSECVRTHADGEEEWLDPPSPPFFPSWRESFAAARRTRRGTNERPGNFVRFRPMVGTSRVSGWRQEGFLFPLLSPSCCCCSPLFAPAERERRGEGRKRLLEASRVLPHEEKEKIFGPILEVG